MSSAPVPARLPAAHSISVLREQIAPGAPDPELAYFAQVCARLDLSPFADQIVLIPRYDSRVGRVVYRHQITVAGRRTLATRTGRLRGIDGPVWCGPRADPDAPLIWRDVWDEDQPPYCARVLVYVDGWQVPANGTAKWDEFAQRDRESRLLPLWKSMPSHMLGKVAESMALRRGFPDVIDPAIADEWPQPVSVDADDVAELIEAEAEPRSSSTSGSGPSSSSTAGPLPAGWQPTITQQAAAHQIIGALGDDEREQFLEHWSIEDFGVLWPAGAVADALELEVGTDG